LPAIFYAGKIGRQRMRAIAKREQEETDEAFVRLNSPMGFNQSERQRIAVALTCKDLASSVKM